VKLEVAKLIVGAPDGWAVRHLGKQLVFLSPMDSRPSREIVYTLRKDGSVIYMDYYENGTFHREDGPAVTVYDESGNIIEELSYIHGKIVQRKMP
jgi:hypothetical protein